MKYNIKRSQGTCVFKSLKYSPNEIMGFNANARVKTLSHLFLLSTHQWFLVLTFGRINTKVSQTLLGDSAALYVVQRERKKDDAACVTRLWRGEAREWPHPSGKQKWSRRPASLSQWHHFLLIQHPSEFPREGHWATDKRKDKEIKTEAG